MRSSMKKARSVAVAVWFTCELADQIGRITVPKPTPPGPAPAPVAVTAEPRFTG